MRYTTRDDCGNAQLNEGVRLMDALNRLAQLEDWWDAVEAKPIIHCGQCRWADWYSLQTDKGEIVEKYCNCMKTRTSGHKENDFCSHGEFESDHKEDK